MLLLLLGLTILLPGCQHDGSVVGPRVNVV